MTDEGGSKQISGDGALSDGNLYEGSYQDFAGEHGITSTGWAEAYSKDERGNKNTRSESKPHQRSRQSRQATFRAKERWGRTVARARQTTHDQATPASQYRDTSWQPASKGWWDEDAHRRLWGGFFLRLRNWFGG